MEADSAQCPATAILHLDADRFFLAVHARADPSVREGPATPPIALYQYNDVICASAKARALGVRKHMSPQAARALLHPAGGRLVHAFWRDWPGPRIWYGPYATASRELFACVRTTLDSGAAAGAMLERASIDEGYVRVCAPLGSCGSDEDALELAERVATELVAAVADTCDLPVCCGVARNKLLAKLASTHAKALPMGAGGRRIHCVRTPEQAQALLAQTAPSKLHGLGSRAEALAAAGVGSAAQLQALSAAELQQRLRLNTAAALAAHAACRGECALSVVDSNQAPPKSFSVTSWLAHDLLSRLALRTHMGKGGAAVTVGGWVFEPHEGRCKTNESRARRVLLALCIDLEEKLSHHSLSHRQLPTKLTLSWQGPGWTAMPGPGHRAGPTHSRTLPLPPWRLRASALAARCEVARRFCSPTSPPPPPPPPPAHPA